MIIISSDCNCAIY